MFITAVVLSGCAGPRTVSKIREKVLEHSFKIDRKRYLPVPALCSAYNLSWDWNSFSKILILKDHSVEIKLYPGSQLVLCNNQVVNLEAPVRIYKGQIVVPESVIRLFLKEEKLLVPLSKEKRIFSLNRIVIDAGHGGKDPGAIGCGGIQEKAVNLDIARRLKSELSRRHIKAVMTRETDIFLPLKKRSDIANEEEADFFVCIHANSAENASAQGVELYYLDAGYDDFSKAVQIRENAAVKFEDNTQYQYSSDLNATLWDMILCENRIESMEMAQAISSEFKRILKVKTRFVKGAMFYVLKGTKMPSLLVEVGYLTNRDEAARLNNPYYRQMVAEAIAEGIVKYKNSFELNNGFSR